MRLMHPPILTPFYLNLVVAALSFFTHPWQSRITLPNELQRLYNLTVLIMSEYGMSAARCIDYPELQPNPDISGIGVSAAFASRSVC